ncbi:Protein of unknown function [Pyronema omphalodes CBS 100304]|uniref:Uncharacterized protein n=1 Tax=Pyronema omphalodes (strain CBS 100304) TaxID=1076935 RepID=U4L555_PYROM|nr:Protein of unknown function [Pyronema omphalodes CBS 100304]
MEQPPLDNPNLEHLCMSPFRTTVIRPLVPRHRCFVE